MTYFIKKFRGTEVATPSDSESADDEVIEGEVPESGQSSSSDEPAGDLPPVARILMQEEDE